MMFRDTFRVLISCAVFVCALTVAQSQRKGPNASDMLNVTSAQGTEFWITIPPNEILPYPVSALEVYVASAFDTEVEVFDASGDKTIRRQIKSMQVRTLSDKTGETNWTWEVRENEQNARKGIRLRSKKPISVYVMNSKTFSSDGYLALPTSVWGTDYIATGYYDFREFKKWAGGFIIVSGEQGTIVDINLRGTGELDGRTAAGKRINTGQPFTITLDEGDVYMVKGDGESRGTFDLTGTSIRSSKPVGVFGFHERTTMPNVLVNGNGRDHMVEMLPPTNTWGKRYVTIEYNRRNVNGQGKGDVFRVVAKDPQTRWTLKYYDKNTGRLLGQGGGFIAKAGEFSEITQASAPTTITHGYSVWVADKPIFVMQYSCSSSWDGDAILDPFMINVTPEEQFISSTIFQTPTDPSFTRHLLNLIVKTDTADPNYIENLKSIELDGIPLWRHPSAVSPTLLFTRMPDGNHWATVDFSTVATAHRIQSNGKAIFGGYIYGFGQFDSYGWPAAAGFKPTTSVDTMPPVLKGTSVCGDYSYEATELRNIPDPPAPVPIDTDQVETGIAIIDTVIGSNSYNYELILETSQQITRVPVFKRFRYTWRVIEKSKDAFCRYFVMDWAGNITYDSCQYYADKIAFNPSPFSFGKIRLGTNKTAIITIVNNSDGEVELTEAKLLLGTYFSITGGAIPPIVKVPARGSTTVTLLYDGRRETTNIKTDWDKDTLQIRTKCGLFKHPIEGVAAVPRIIIEDFDAGTVGLDEKRCKAGGLQINNPGSDTLVITSINGFLGTNFSLSTPFTPALPIIIPPKGFEELKDVCYQSSSITVDNIDVTFSNNAEGPDSVSNWQGSTQAAGPVITGWNWRQRRVATVHQAICYVYNTGNEVLTLRDVTFADGTRFWPAGSNDANYVFKIVGLFNNGTPVTTINLSGINAKASDSAEVFVLFRPDAQVAFSANISPVWNGTVEPRSAKLEGQGILPAIATQPITLSCAETPDDVVVPRDITITNSGTMRLTVSGFRFAAGTPPAFAVVSVPALPFTVPAGGSVPASVSFTRPTTNGGGFAATVEIVHDAVRGNGIDSGNIVPITHTEQFTVGSCSEPDMTVGNIDFGRQRSTCDAPIMEFRITNPSVSPKPLEVREINEIGADAGYFEIVNIFDFAGFPTTLPLIIPANSSYRVQVQFTPTLPDAAPWADRNYSVQYEVVGYGQGNTAVLKTLNAGVQGVGYVTPVTLNLMNDLGAGASKQPGDVVNFRVGGVSNDWTSADVTSFVADVTIEKAAIGYNLGSIRLGPGLVGGWTVNEPVITDLPGGRAQLRFTATGGTRVTSSSDLFTFTMTLLLGDKFSTRQDMAVSGLRTCVVPAATGDSTTIFNCALTRRVVSINGSRSQLSPVYPNPVNTSTAHVDFGLGLTAQTSIDLINAQGTVVKKFVSGNLRHGEYSLDFDVTGLSAGVYILRLSTAEFTASQQVVVTP